MQLITISFSTILFCLRRFLIDSLFVWQLTSKSDRLTNKTLSYYVLKYAETYFPSIPEDPKIKTFILSIFYIPYIPLIVSESYIVAFTFFKSGS